MASTPSTSSTPRASTSTERKRPHDLGSGGTWVPRSLKHVLSALPTSAHPGAKKALAEIWNAEDKDHARAAVRAFDELYGAKWPEATAKITDDVEELLAFYDYPAEHWIHLRTTNPIESTFATVRHRTKVTKDDGMIHSVCLPRTTSRSS
jgi:transposase-like protein